MGIKFGEIDASQILDNEFRIGVLERLLGWVFSNNLTMRQPTQVDVNQFRKQTFEVLRKKYPNSGITYKEG